jgi:osmotically-inducible protein OsmY
MMNEDEAITKRIMELFLSDARIDLEKITVEVVERNVRLTGTVQSLAEMVAVENAAYQIPEVNQVENLIEIIYPGEKDDVEDHIIEEKVRSFIEEHLKLDVSQAEIRVDEGVVTLKGVINSLRKKDRLKNILQKVPGVDLVINKLDIVTSLDMRDVGIAREVRKAIDTISELDSEMVTIGVKNGEVTLIGKVPTMDVFYNAQYLSKMVEGVMVVKNETLIV